MKRRQIALFTLILLMSLGSLVQAQPRNMEPDSTRIRKMMTDLDEAVTLSDNQKVEVEQMYTDHFEEMKTLRDENDGYRRQMMETMSAQQEKLKENISSVLDEDQQEKYADFVAKQRKKHRGGMMGGRGRKK